MTEPKILTREDLITAIAAIDVALGTVTTLLFEASDAKAPRKDVLTDASLAYAKLHEAKKHVAAAFAAFGVRPV